MNRQDGPLLVGALNENTNVAKPLLVTNAGELIVTTSGSGGVSDVNLDEVGGVAITLGQKPMATSIPVVIASDQSAIPITGSITASNPSVDATGGAVPSDATYIGINLGGNLSGAVAGHGTAAAALRVELPTDGTGVLATVGAVTSITNPVTVTGTVVVDTSLLATAANQVTEIASLSVLDDWDESDRAKVNPIVGQAGVAGGTGVDGATVQRVSLATNVPLPTGSNVIGHVIADSGSTTAVTGNVTVVQATASSLNAQVVGDVADSATDAGNPVKVGNKALAFGANPTAVSAGERTNAYANVAGIPFTLPGHPNVLTLRYNATAAETNTKLITVSGGTKIVMLACTIAVDKACTVNVAARVGFAATNTPTTTGVYLSHPGIAPGNGIREAGAVPGADGDDFILTSTVPTTGSVDVVMKYFTIPE